VIVPDWNSETLELARALVRIPSAREDHEGQRRAATLVAKYLADAGVQSDIQSVRDSEANLFARLPGQGSAKALVLSGHLDTVPVGSEPWTRDPLGAEVEAGYLYGRGSADMKGAVAAMACAVKQVASSGTRLAGDVILALTADEESDCGGARALLRSGMMRNVDWLVVGEPTGLDVGCAHKGLIWLDIEATGRRGHGALVVPDENAILRLVNALEPFEELERAVEGTDALLGRGSVALTRLRAGDAPNVAPASASATLDVRTLPQHDHAVVRSRLCDRFDRSKVLREGAPVFTDPDDPFVRATVDVSAEVTGSEPDVRGVSYLTDASILASGGEVKTVIIGPGDEAEAHTVDERVPCGAVLQARDVYRGLIERLLIRNE